MFATHTTASYRRKGTGIFATLIAFILLLTSCKVTWVPEHSDTLETQIIQAAKNTNRLYLEMIDDQSGRKTYERFSSKYIELELEINSILLINESRKNNKDMVQLARTVHDKFIEYKKEHQKKGSLSTGEIETYDDYMKAFWKPLLVAEQSLK